MGAVILLACSVLSISFKFRNINLLNNLVLTTMLLFQAEMLHANDTIRRLEEKLSEMALAKEELEKGQSEYLEMVKQLEESKNMEAEERARLEEEMHAKREEVSDSLHS